MKTLARFVLVSALLLVVDNSPVHAQSEADAIGIGSAAAPATSVTSLPQAALKYADASIGFEFEYKVDNAAVCVIWPEQSQDSGCKGIDLPKMVAYAAANASMQRSLAFLRYDNGFAVITVGHVPSTKTFISQVEIDDVLDGVLAGMKKAGPAKFTMSGSAIGSRYDVTEINGVEALRFEVTSDGQRGTLAYLMGRTVGYVLLGKHGMIMMTAATDPQHMRQTRVAMESIMKTVRLPPLPQKGFGKASPWIQLLDGPLGLFLLVLVVAGLLSMQSYLARKNRKRSSQRS